MAKKSTFEERIYIKEGKFMRRLSDDTYFTVYVNMDVLYNEIETYLKTNPKDFSFKKIIETCVKNVTHSKSCIHCKTPSQNPHVTYMVDDPLYESLIVFIRNSENYKENYQKEIERSKIKSKRKQDAFEGKRKEKSVDSFFVEAHLQILRKRHLKKRGRK